MRTESKGIVLKRSKPVGGRSMITLLTEKYGKISCGAYVEKKSNNKTNLALGPFTLADYQLFKNRDKFNIGSADVVKTYYDIGENVDRYMAGSRILELTDKFLAEDEPAPAIYSLMIEYLDELAVRAKEYDTLNTAFKIKALRILGIAPGLHECVSCGSKEDLQWLDVGLGGRICSGCYEDIKKTGSSSLILSMPDDIVNIIEFLMKKPLPALRKLSIKPEAAEQLDKITDSWISYHLEIKNLKSDTIRL